MILEGVVAAACFYGNGEACNSSLHGYVKHHKLDERAQVIEQNVKRRYPGAHFMAMTAGTIVHKKYNFMLYRNIWYNGDLSNPNDIKNMLIFKYSY